ncbi:guanylate kinase [Putridiphycobacter roseus]|uniref:Guanylate kinase n=1 Tax=Putridiphycobacter roseus TaxID=2219161 RepID=A0A2W1MZG3_9FLAO|nr:guanylate kinase [Putridiphycobacter roseus]PZE16650.1 guanylate kinase [Putridiphycobacter roseus]
MNTSGHIEKPFWGDLPGKCIIFSAPSGAGKTTIVKYLLRQIPNLSFSISAASRQPRGKEESGVDYHFFTVAQFKERIEKKEFVEWEEVYTNNFYGTLKSEVLKAWKNNKIVVFDVDALGGKNLKSIFGERSISIFIKPPSLFVLEQRLKNRGTETPEQIKMRLDKANEEIAHADDFDYTLLNDNLEHACAEIKVIIQDFIQT